MRSLRPTLAFAFSAGAILPFLACTSFGDAPEEITPGMEGGAADDAAVADSPAANPDGAPPTTAFCKTVSPIPTECVDFENGSIPQVAPWSAIVQPGDASAMELITTTECGPKDSTRCVEVRGAVGAGESGGAGLRLSIGGEPRDVSMSGSFRVASIANGVFDAFSVVMAEGGTLWALEVEIDEQGRGVIAEYVLGGGGLTETKSPPTQAAIAPAGEWVTLSLTLEVGVLSHATLRADGAIVAEKDVVTKTLETFSHVDFGDVQADPGLGWQVRMDNLTVTYAK